MSGEPIMEDLSRYYSLLRDPSRRKIIEILATYEKMGIKELRETLGLGVGTVYYHLDMLSGFVTQDKKRKYLLTERGRMLHKVLKEGSIPAALEIGEAFSHRVGRWLFLSPVFTKTIRPLRWLPVSALILGFGAIGAALASIDPILFFYFPFSSYEFETIATLFLFNWIGVFLLSNLLIYVLIGGVEGIFSCSRASGLPLSR